MSYQTGPRIVTNGLVFCVDAADTNSYAGSGTTWNDLSGNGNNGTLTNGPTFNSANRGSIVFDGINDHISTPNFVISSNSYFSISAWVRLSVGAGQYPLIVSSKSGSVSTAILFGIKIGSNGATGFNLYIGANGQGANLQTTNNTVPNTNQWYNVVGLYDGSAKIYVNSSLISTSISGNSYGLPSGVYIGYGGILGNSYWLGNMSSVQIHNRALSASEIAQNYNATKGRYGF